MAIDFPTPLKALDLSQPIYLNAHYLLIPTKWMLTYGKALMLSLQ